MSGIKGLVGRKMTKKIKFCGEDIEITKLSVAETLAIQAKAKELGEEETAGIKLLQVVIVAAVPDAKDLSDDEFQSFPIDELSKLSAEIMKFSGMGQEAGK